MLATCANRTVASRRQMRLLDKYLLRELLVPLFFCVVGFVMFWDMLLLFTELSTLQDNRFVEICQYLLLKTPAQAVVILPFALLLGLLYALSNHARHHEITAIRAAGVSLWRLSLPYFTVGLICGGILFVANEFLVPDGDSRAEQIKQGTARKDKPATEQKVRNLGFTNERDSRAWLIGSYDLLTSEMVSPMVIWTLPDGSQQWLKAAKAQFVDGSWRFFDALEFRADPRTNPSLVPSLQTNLLLRPEFTETPDEIRSEIKISNRLSVLGPAREADLPLLDIFDYLRLHPNLKRSDKWWLYTKLHGRLAAPWTCLVVVLIALPFGAASGRRNVFVGVASSIFIAFGFLVVTRISLALGTGGHLPAWVAGWLPNIVFGSIGLWMTARVR